jgi:hypothetical protein
MPTLRPATALAALLALASCAYPTPYIPATTPGGEGYYETQIEANRFRVSFKGNTVTPRETVENFLLYRAAELTLKTGNDHFVIADAQTDRDVSYRWDEPAYYGNFGWWGPRWRRGFIGAGGGYGGYGYSRPINEYSAQADILVNKGGKPANATNAYDAREVLNRLGPYVQAASTPDAAPRSSGY